MKTDVTEALRQLRAADPASDVPDEQWAGSAAQALTKHQAPERVPLDVPAPATRWTRRWPAALAAAAVVAGISVAAVELSNGHGTSRQPVAEPTGSGSQSRPAPPVSTNGSEAPTSSTPPAPTGPDPHKLEAERFVRHILRQAPVLPGAKRRATAANPEVRQGRLRNAHPIEHPGPYFVAPGTMDQAIAYLRNHVPPGMRLNGTGTGSRYGVVTSESISYVTWSLGNVRDAELNIFVAPYRGGVAVGMYADAEWIPSRPADTLIAGATSVVVTVRRGGAKPANPQLPHAPTVRRTLTGSDVAKLAGIVNRLAPAIPGARSCPFGEYKFDDTLVFATPAGSVRAIDSITGCAGVALKLAGGPHIELESGQLDAAVLHALGLPHNYGQR